MVINLKYKLLQILNILSLLAVIIVNALANALPINDLTTGEISAMFPNLFTPAGITFSIWGLIYLLLAGFIFYQARGLLGKRELNKELLDRINILFIISSLANIVWIFTWHYLKIELSFLIMLILASSLIIIYRRLKTAQRGVKAKERLFVHLPFSIYTAWITVATLANLTVLFVEWDIYAVIIPEILWTITMIAIATAVGIYIYQKYRDIYYNLVIIWALLGIVIQRVFIAEQLVLSVVIAAVAGVLTIASRILIFD